jgi:small subunit ribosomal protein S7
MRKSRAKKRQVIPDPKFHSELVTRFVNMLMYSGKKGTGFKLFYDALEKVENRTKENGLETWRTALNNVMPAVEVRSRRVGGATFQIPTPIRDERKSSMAMKWLIGYARSRNEKSMSEKLAGEIIAASKGEGAAYKKKEDVHRMADANKAFAHFRV